MRLQVSNKIVGLCSATNLRPWWLAKENMGANSSRQAELECRWRRITIIMENINGYNPLRTAAS